MACPHLTAAFSTLAPPRPSQQVHKEECTLCFDDHDTQNGIDVCLSCFNGACTGADNDRNHSQLHFQKTQHPIVVNIRRVPKPKPANQHDASPPKKLAILAESDADKFDYITTPRCLACNGDHLPNTEKLQHVIDGVMNAMSSAQQSEVEAWEEEIVPCHHTSHLVQPGDAHQLDLGSLASCGKCDLTSNLWLCLTCGHLGCGRAQFGGVGGNSHGLAHFEETGHPVSVKQGTITAEGTADIYCYACNDARIDPLLAQHLAHFGINVVDLSKTEKSMTELQLEQNLKFDFTMTGEDGKRLEPLFGPGNTGLRNLGNSCYMASVLQSLFALPSFQSRYRDSYRPHTLACTAAPAACFDLGGQADVEMADPAAAAPADAPIFQAGIRPSMFKALVGKGHEEFSTMRQQDADEFLKHLVDFIKRENRRLPAAAAAAPANDPTAVFSFGLEQRLQCNSCKKVRYSVEAQDAGLGLPVPIRPRVKPSAGSSSKQPAEGVHAPDAASSAKAASAPVEYEAVSLVECLDLLTAPEEIEYHCPSCNAKVSATKQTRFSSFPEVLAVQARRFQLVNWVPTKVNVPVEVPLEPFELDRYLGKGLQEGEELLPEDDAAAAAGGSQGGSAAGTVTFDAGAMSQLASMGFPEVRCQKALLATGNSDAEAAMNWLFAHMDDADIDDPIDPSALFIGGGGGGGGAFASTSSTTNKVDTAMLEEMGFTRAQSLKALRLNHNNAEMAVAWLFEHSDDQGDVDDAEEPAAGASAADAQPSSAAGAGAVVGGTTTLPARYALKSFISHKGPSVHSGHYVAHIRRDVGAGSGSGEGEGEGEGAGEGWVFFNDEKVVKAPLSAKKPVADAEEHGDEVEQEDVGVVGLSKLAYEYFFERV
ncbi:uncharacterized protein PFL1_00668 [Pseudozyma flocculosa PF-1]|uniref:uncharacterized protein n=1 Tax=Pseudozyma flocculosa PF-1 TaxID=1277687 RepID=UPI0004560849|nr:uncharacterized protein PFL1_00668 [Pseudozyma flocculosa PF-1]EPQ32473.1 hypothetical protein PFL1_00668 [Pseudozyma flocculosa PF-1]